MSTIIEIEPRPICKKCHRRLQIKLKQALRFEIDDFCETNCSVCGVAAYGRGDVPCQYVTADDYRCTRSATKEYRDNFDEATLLCSQHLAIVLRNARLYEWRLSTRPACPRHPRRQLSTNLRSGTVHCLATLCGWSLSIPDEVLDGTYKSLL